MNCEIRMPGKCKQSDTLPSVDSDPREEKRNFENTKHASYLTENRNQKHDGRRPHPPQQQKKTTQQK